MIYERIRSLLFRLPPETSHRLAMDITRAALAFHPLEAAIVRAAAAPVRETRVFGRSFRNPIGIAAGFDKNARYIHVLRALGFGFLEIGSVTAQPWTGNERPRLFRLPRDRALLNRMGLGNDGATAVAARLAKTARALPIFGNVAQTPNPSLDLDGGVADYVFTTERLAPHVDAIVLNVSCPNTAEGRTFEDPRLLDRLLSSIRDVLPAGVRPLLVKISSDLGREVVLELMRVCERHAIDGFVAVNTTTDRRGLRTDEATIAALGAGGISGAPLLERALETIEILRGPGRVRLPIIGVGGVFTASDASRMLQAGADLIEVYTGFVYEGPHLVKNLVAGAFAGAHGTATSHVAEGGTR